MNTINTIFNKRDLINYLDHGNVAEYIFFWGSKGEEINHNCLSQFFPASFVIDAVRYKTAEHYYMAEKARFFNDEKNLDLILKIESPLEAKKIGRKVKNFDDALWAAKRFQASVMGNRAKFNQNKLLKEYLLSTTGNVLVEASPYDTIWGIGLSQDDPDAHNPHMWRGENLLGFALMQVRHEL